MLSAQAAEDCYLFPIPLFKTRLSLLLLLLLLRLLLLLIMMTKTSMAFLLRLIPVTVALICRAFAAQIQMKIIGISGSSLDEHDDRNDEKRIRRNVSHNARNATTRTESYESIKCVW